MFKRILVPIDLGDRDGFDRSMDVAEELAAKHGAELHVMTVLPSYNMPIVGSYFPPEHEERATKEGQAALGDLLAGRGGKAKGHVGHGTIYDEILKAAQKLGCDLIVMASHRPELKDYLLGPNAARVVRHAKQSVFVVRDAR